MIGFNVLLLQNKLETIMFALKNKNQDGGVSKPVKASREPTEYNKYVAQHMPHYHNTLGLPVTDAMKHIAKEYKERNGK